MKIIFKNFQYTKFSFFIYSNMLTIQSPNSNLGQNNNGPNSKIDLLSNVSPTFRNKRIPSAHDNYSYSSNQNLKIIKS